jgi:hypothetical protein
MDARRDRRRDAELDEGIGLLGIDEGELDRM